HVGESAVAIVAVQNILSVLSNVEVCISIAIVVACRDSHSISAPGYSRLLGYILEASVAIVSVQRISNGLFWLVEITFPAVDEINVHPAVIIEIKKRAAGAARLRQVFHRGFSGCVHPVDAAFCSRYLFEPGRCRWRRQCAETL